MENPQKISHQEPGFETQFQRDRNLKKCVKPIFRKTLVQSLGEKQITRTKLGPIILWDRSAAG